MTDMLDTTNPGNGRPRYRQLADTLLSEIRSGRIAVGERIPGELELVQRYGCSRHTVRESLRVLEDLGMIDRQQGLGTVVTSNHAAPSYVQMIRSPAELMQYPEESVIEVVETEEVKASRALAKRLRARAGSEWTRIGTLRRLKDTNVAICWTDIYVLPEYAGVTEKFGIDKRPVFEILAETYGEEITGVDIDFKASLIGDAVARALDVEPGSPSLVLTRHYIGKGNRQFEVSIAQHPASRFTYSMSLRRGWKSDEGWATE